MSIFSLTFLLMVQTVYLSGVMAAVENIVESLKSMSKPVTTPEEIAQVSYCSPNQI